ncbi:MAG: phosphotransferase family protein [Bacteroidota bacterium]
MSTTPLDRAKSIRKGEELNIPQLDAYLRKTIEGFDGISDVKQFPGGFSNLTYLIQSGDKEYVMRRPPFGANIKSAHDMGREFKVLSLLKGHYAKAPFPVVYCTEESVIGAPFYLMDRIKGVVLRASKPPTPLPDADQMQRLSQATIDNLVALHALDIDNTGLIHMGKPDGYTERQITGWIKRYGKAKTDEIPEMEALAEFLAADIPKDVAPAFIHNDYKYDNMILDPGDYGNILAVLDWEMATVGNPLMDLATSLSYWTEAKDSPALKMFNLTSLPGNLSRLEALQRYTESSGRDTSDILYHFVYACYKLAVILQQIYARFARGYTQDPRFGALIHVVKACSTTGKKALELNRIHDLY